MIKELKEKIEKFKNINNLPLLKDFDKEYYFDEDWEGIVTIADGTKIELVYDSSLSCFNDKEHWFYYYIKEVDIYICAECGLWEKDYKDIKDKIGYEEFYGIKLLPSDWNRNGVQTYIRKGKEMQKKREERYEYRDRPIELEKNFYRDCDNCKHMIHNECMFDNKECEDCEEWELREI